MNRPRIGSSINCRQGKAQGEKHKKTEQCESRNEGLKSDSHAQSKLGQGTAAAHSKRERIRQQCPTLANGIKNKFTKN
jgi:hypothetical protein